MLGRKCHPTPKAIHSTSPAYQLGADGVHSLRPKIPSKFRLVKSPLSRSAPFHRTRFKTTKQIFSNRILALPAFFPASRTLPCEYSCEIGMDERNTSGERTDSSLNAVKHGCRAKTVILPGEKQSDFDATWERWMTEFQPDTDAGVHFVEQIVLNDWFFQRTLKRYNQMEEKLVQKNFVDWTPEDHKQLQLSNRYKGEAQRALDRSIRTADCWRKNRTQEVRQAEQDLRRAQRDVWLDTRYSLEEQCRALKEQIRALEKGVPPQKLAAAKPSDMPSSQKTKGDQLFHGQNHPKKQSKIHTLEQWAEIAVEDGKTVTRLFPSNEELIEDGKAMDPPPDLIYRRLDFVNGVPPEYRWSTNDEEKWRFGGLGIQRMTVDTWLQAIEREKQDPGGHLTPVGNLPRPQERGGCDCPVCTKNQAILDSRARKQADRRTEPRA